MFSIVGLGNPGKKYELTRHNIGFIIIDKFAEKNKLHFEKKENYQFVEGSIGSSTFFLVKPTTYMNMCGLAVEKFVVENNILLENLLIVVDDINLQLGKIRLRKSGGDGGHNGLKSIIYHLKNSQFPRLRFGIGSNFEKGDMAEYVLSNFTNDEFNTINGSINFSLELIEKFIQGGYKLMSDYFSRNKFS